MPNNYAQELKDLRDKALRYLAIRNRSDLELTAYLAKKSQNTELIQSLIDRFKQLNLIDNHRFAQEWINSRLKHGKGPRFIRYELKMKGISEADINSALAKISPFEWTKSAKEILAKKIVGFRLRNPRFLTQKVKNYLYQRGFDNSHIKTIIDDLAKGK